jgi:hypothetical protein
MPLREHADRIEWHTYLGGRANNLLARLLVEKLGGTAISDNFVLTMKDDAAKSLAAAREVTADLLRPGHITHEDALRHADSCARGRLSKFQPCLPSGLEREFLASRLLEIPLLGCSDNGDDSAARDIHSTDTH